jgi:cytochrome c peroxidase
MRTTRLSHVGLALVVVLAVGCEEQKAPPPKPAPAPTPAPPVPTGTQISKLQLAAFQPLPPKMESPEHPITDAKVALGKVLFADAKMACNSCHNLEGSGANSRPTDPATAHKGKIARNAPTVYNAAGHLSQMWDGRSKDVESIDLPLDDKKVEAVLKAHAAELKVAYPDGAATVAHAKEALGAYLRTLVKPGRWDKFLGGDDKALTEDEKKGFLVFVNTGCQACHLGAFMGGMSYQKLGLQKPWPETFKDTGRAMATGQKTDEGIFKVPSLRLVDKTGPYLHDGSEPSLEKVVAKMAVYQSGKELKDDEVKSIIAFLKSFGE